MSKSGHEIRYKYLFCNLIAFFKEKDAFRTRNMLGKLMQTQTVLIIERGLIIFSHPTLRLYSTYNRKYLKGIQTVLIIEQYL